MIVAKKFPLIPQARRRGARSGIVAWVTVHTHKPGGRDDRRLRNMRPARPVTAAAMRQLTDQFYTDPDAAAEQFLAAFLDLSASPKPTAATSNKSNSGPTAPPNHDHQSDTTPAPRRQPAPATHPPPWSADTNGTRE